MQNVSFRKVNGVPVISEGLQIVEQNVRRRVDPRWQRGLSYLKIDLRALQYALARGQAIFSRLGLHGSADPEPVRCRASKQPYPRNAGKAGRKLIFRPVS